MSKREGLYFYRDWIEPFACLSDEERGRLVLAMMKYAMEGEEPPRFDGGANIAALFLFPQIDRALLFQETGKRGGEARVAAEKKEERGEERSEPRYREVKAEEKPSNDTAKAEKDAECDVLFERFWAEYPKKTAKKDAKRAFAALCVDEPLLLRMLKAIGEQKEQEGWKSENGRYIPAPAIWLDRGQWEDEISAAEPKKKDPPIKKKVEGSFDTDEMFEAALRRSYGDMYDSFFDGVSSP